MPQHVRAILIINLLISINVSTASNDIVHNGLTSDDTHDMSLMHIYIMETTSNVPSNVN